MKILNLKKPVQMYGAVFDVEPMQPEQWRCSHNVAWKILRTHIVLHAHLFQTYIMALQFLDKRFVPYWIYKNQIR